MNGPPRIIDQFGNPMKPSATAHFAASTDSRELANWTPYGGSADADYLPERGTIVSRSRDLVRNNGIAAGAARTELDNVIGTGLRLQASPDWRALGKDKTWAVEWSATVEAGWRGYAESPDFEIDAAGRRNFHGLIRAAQMCDFQNGEVLALALWLRDPGRRYRTAIQMVEPDRLSNPQNRPDRDRLRAGVETDRRGRAVAYHIRNRHPGDTLGLSMISAPGRWVRVPARTGFGRRRVIHAFDSDRIDATRGKPRLTPIIEKLKMIDRYERMEVQSAVVNAMFAAALETPFDPVMVAEALGADGLPEYMEERAAFHNERKLSIDHAKILHLYPGEQLKTISPGHPQQQFAAFVDAVMNHVAAGLNQPKELLLRDFSKSNYSSARAALIEAWRFFRTQRAHIQTGVAVPVYLLWLEEFINAGGVEAPDFYENKAHYVRARWIGPARGWVDPAKEAGAAKLRLGAGLSTLEQECAEQGLDWEEVLEQRLREKEVAEELGLPDPHATTQGMGPRPNSHIEPRPPAAPPEPDPEQERPAA